MFRPSTDPTSSSSTAEELAFQSKLHMHFIFEVKTWPSSVFWNARERRLISIWCHEHPSKKFSHRQRWTLIGNTSISNFYGTCNGTVDILIYWLLFVCIKPRWTFVSPVSVVRWWLIGQFCGTFVDKNQRSLVSLLIILFLQFLVSPPCWAGFVFY